MAPLRVHVQFRRYPSVLQRRVVTQRVAGAVHVVVFGVQQERRRRVAGDMKIRIQRILLCSQGFSRALERRAEGLDKYSSRGVIITHVGSHACRRNGDSRFAGRGGADRAGPVGMAGGRTIQRGGRRRRALAVAIQRPAHSPRGGTGRTLLHRDRRADGDARFRSHAPDVGSRSRRTRRARHRFRRSPSQHQSDHRRGKGPAASSRWRRRRSRQAQPRVSRSYSTHRPPRPAGRFRTTPTLELT